MAEILMAHIDYENIRWRFRDYVEFITIDDVIKAFKGLGTELGDLRQVFFYGDWTRRPDDARKIEEQGCRAENVLSKIRGADRSDQTMSFAIDDQARENREVTAFLVGAGDADYKEVILRCRERGKRVYVLCFGMSASRELFTMTDGVYPLEVRLSLTERNPKAMPAPDLVDAAAKRIHMIAKLDSLEKTLPYVVRLYFLKLLKAEGQYGETLAEIEKYPDEELRLDYMTEIARDNPRNLGKSMRCLTLNRESDLVMEALGATQNGRAKP